MNNVLELREKRTKLWETAKSFLDDTKRDANGMVSPEDSATYDKMEADIVALGKEIERLDRQNALELELSKPTSEPITNAPQETVADKTGRTSNEYSKEFLNSLRGAEPARNVLSTDPGTDGGYIVPTEFERQLVQGLDEYNVVRRIAKIIKTAAEREIPVVTDTSVATWTAENAQIKESTPKFGQEVLRAYKLAVISRVSNEILQDSMFDLASFLTNDFARAFGAAEEEAFCVGTETGRPTGIFTEKGGEVGETAGATVNASFVDNLINLVYSLKSPYRRNAVWLMHDKSVSAVRKLKDANGQFLWQPSVQAGEPDKLLGYRLFTSPYAPEVAPDALAFAFGDFNSYWIADRMARIVKRLTERYADFDQTGFRCTQRVDGKVILREGIKLLQMGSA